jgi:hypothetical protein
MCPPTMPQPAPPMQARIPPHSGETSTIPHSAMVPVRKDRISNSDAGNQPLALIFGHNHSPDRNPNLLPLLFPPSTPNQFRNATQSDFFRRFPLGPTGDNSWNSCFASALNSPGVNLSGNSRKYPEISGNTGFFRLAPSSSFSSSVWTSSPAPCARAEGFPAVTFSRFNAVTPI